MAFKIKKTNYTSDTDVLIQNLKEYLLNEFGSIIFKDASRDSNCKNQILCNKKCFENISEVTFKSFLKKNNPDENYINIKDIVKFLSSGEANKSTNTKGRYHELLPMIFGMYKIPIMDDLPDI